MTSTRGQSSAKAKLKLAARLALKSLTSLIDPILGSVPGPRILIYHQVGTNLRREMEVTAGAFARQLDWVQENGEVVDLATAIDRRGEPDADRLFVLTFDDGFEDVYRNAFPLLKERGLPFTLYLTTYPIEIGEPLDPRYPDAKPLTWNQINEMVGTGLVTLGAHTHTHPDLRGLPLAEIAGELDTSNRLIEERTGVTPHDFTYPWGWWSKEADGIVRDLYRSATLGSGSPMTLESDSHLINRIPIQRSDGAILAFRKLRTGARAENAIRRKMHSYSGP